MKIKIDLSCPLCGGDVYFDFIEGETDPINVVYKCASCEHEWHGYLEMINAFLLKGVSEGMDMAFRKLKGKR